MEPTTEMINKLNCGICTNVIINGKIDDIHWILNPKYFANAVIPFNTDYNFPVVVSGNNPVTNTISLTRMNALFIGTDKSKSLFLSNDCITWYACVRNQLYGYIDYDFILMIEHNNLNTKRNLDIVDFYDNEETNAMAKNIIAKNVHKHIIPIQTILANISKSIYSVDTINPLSGNTIHCKIYPDIMQHTYKYLMKYAVMTDDNFPYVFATEKELYKLIVDIVIDNPTTRYLYMMLKVSYNEIHNGIDPNTVQHTNIGPSKNWKDNTIDLHELINHIHHNVMTDVYEIE